MKIAVGGSAANPPHYGHRMLVEAVLATNKFDQVRWTVSGDRPDKPGLPNSIFRWEMGKMVMDGLRALNVLYEPERAIPTFFVISNLQRCYKNAKITWYCGADHFVPRERFNGNCDILGFWDKGEYLFKNQKFLIIPRKRIDLKELQLPMFYEILDVNIPEISSTEIRRLVKNDIGINHLTSGNVEKYIKEMKLY